MATIEEITQVAKKAIDESMSHYFINLASGEAKVHESKFVGEVLMAMQGWLIFTEDSLQNIQDMVLKDSLHINLIYTLTALFYNRFTLPREDYDALVDHLAQSFDTKEAEDDFQSFMPKEYRARLADPKYIASLLRNNRSLVMLTCLYTYFNVEILMEGVK